MAPAFDALTEKEKDTLRLIVRGHDAKSAARELDLSVHTVNERLRHARRKLDVTSSREAARLLLESEVPQGRSAPKNSVYESFGGESAGTVVQSSVTTPFRTRALLIGGIAMTSLLALTLALAFGVTGQSPVADNAAEARAQTVAKADAEREAAARRWLALVDAQDWEASFEATRSQFRQVNTLAKWRDASLHVRVPLGAVISRRAIASQAVPSPEGYEAVRFETHFENGEGVVETVSLVREGGVLKVAGYYID